MNFSSIRAKLIFLLIIIGAIPMIIAIVISSSNTVSNTIESVKEDLKIKNDFIAQDISSMIGNNFIALRLLALNPTVQDYLMTHSATDIPQMKTLIQNSNSLFNDSSNIVLTGNDGEQIVRSDSAKLVNLKSRDYFQEAMRGNENVSDVIVSKTSGLSIVVIEVPVKNSAGNVVGMLQRNYNISILNEVVNSQADENTEIFILDAHGKLVARSNFEIKSEEDRIDMSGYEFFGKAKTEKNGIAEENFDGEHKIISFAVEKHTGWIIATTKPYSFVTAQAYSQAYVLAGIGFLLLVGIAALAAFIAKSAVKPIQLISSTAGEISAGNLAVEKVPVNSNDELGQVATAFEKMTDKLNNFFRKSQKSTTEVANAAENLNNNSQQSAEAANQIAASITKVAAETSEQKNFVAAAINTVENMQHLLEIIEKNSKEMADASIKTSSTAENGAGTIGNAEDAMKSLEKTVQESAKVIQSLGEHSKEIGQIVDTISAIAAQTNLLALNAAIEAARAGEHGRGFAVVAEEVRKLAEQSATAADQINQLIQNVQTQTDKAVETMQAGTVVTSKSVEIVHETGEAFREIVRQVAALSDKVQQATTAVKKANEGRIQITDAINKIETAAANLSTEAETVSASTQELSASIEEIAAASRQLSGMAEELDSDINTFKLRR
ncbi:MAG: HAMP domain-containing protein [Selenomonadaceae bacterium]|nr:HAMP domain-containing protein [Selenomonadaceae bacterium]